MILIVCYLKSFCTYDVKELIIYLYSLIRNKTHCCVFSIPYLRVTKNCNAVVNMLIHFTPTKYVNGIYFCECSHKQKIFLTNHHFRRRAP